MKALLVCGLMFGCSTVCQSQRAAEIKSLAPALESSSHLATRPAVHESALLGDSILNSQQDTFLGSDKVKHFLMSGFIEAVGFSALQTVGVNRGASFGAATTATMAIGVGRELHDRRTKGLFSMGDLGWDAIGAGAALILISHSQR